jgi:hypothetical protein
MLGGAPSAHDVWSRNKKIQKLQMLHLVSLRNPKAVLSLISVVPKLYRKTPLMIFASVSAACHFEQG